MLGIYDSGEDALMMSPEVKGWVHLFHEGMIAPSENTAETQSVPCVGVDFICTNMGRCRESMPPSVRSSGWYLDANAQLLTWCGLSSLQNCALSGLEVCRITASFWFTREEMN